MDIQWRFFTACIQKTVARQNGLQFFVLCNGTDEFFGISIKCMFIVAAFIHQKITRKFGTNLMDFFAVSPQIFFLLRKKFCKIPHKIFGALRLWIFIIIIIKCYFIKDFIHFFYLKLFHDAQKTEIAVKILTFRKTTDIMYTGIKKVFVARKCLKITAILLVFLQHTNTQAFFGQNKSGNQASKSASDDDDVVVFFQNNE